MRKLLAISLVLMLVVPLCSFTAADASPKVIVCIGDSLTQRDVYCQKLRGLVPDWEIINKGVSGEQTADMSANFTDVINAHPYAVIIWGGTNDINYYVAPEVVETNLYSMYKRARESGIKVVALNISPRGGAAGAPAEPSLSAINTWISTAPYIDYFVDVYGLLNDPMNPGRLLSAYDGGDGLHLSTQGYEIVADLIYETLFVNEPQTPHPPGDPPYIAPPPPPQTFPGGGSVNYNPEPSGSTGLNFGGLTVNDYGLVFYDKEISSSDGIVTLKVDAGITAMNKENPVRIIKINDLTEDLPENCIKAVDLTPNNALFTPGVSLSFIYKPESVNGTLDIISWNGTGWKSVENFTVNEKINSVSCNITHFSKYALVSIPDVVIPDPVIEPVAEYSAELELYIYQIMWFINGGKNEKD